MSAVGAANTDVQAFILDYISRADLPTLCCWRMQTKSRQIKRQRKSLFRYLLCELAGDDQCTDAISAASRFNVAELHIGS
jgi:hypothetical protein